MTENGNEERLSAPNQQVVRPDASGPWDEGTGGSAREPDETPEQTSEAASTEEAQRAEQAEQQQPEKPRRTRKTEQ